MYKRQNLDMVTEYKPELKGFMTTNAAGAQGQGIEMATAVGADTVDMDQIQIPVSYTHLDVYKRQVNILCLRKP